jgi:hypothetical protein
MNAQRFGAHPVWRACALLLLFLLALFTLVRRNESLRSSYRARQQLEQVARLENEVRWMEARRERAFSASGLLERSASSTRGGRAQGGHVERVSPATDVAGPLGN